MINNSSEPKPSEQMTEEELREELEYLRAENAVLKKLEALVQAKNKNQRKDHSGRRVQGKVPLTIFTERDRAIEKRVLLSSRYT